MSTGYTQAIGTQEGISFRNFALACANHFLRTDKPLDAEVSPRFEPSPRHKEGFRTAVRKFYRVIGMRNDEAERLADDDYVRRVKDHERSSQEREELAVEYAFMSAEVLKWQPPSQDHLPLKNFMLDQLTTSLNDDCGYHLEAPKKESAEEYRAAVVKTARIEMETHKKLYLEEVRNARQKTEWVNALRESLPRI